MQDHMLSQVHKHIVILSDFLSQVANSSFQHPLCIAHQWANSNSFRCNVCQKMDTLVDEVDP